MSGRSGQVIDGFVSAFRDARHRLRYRLIMMTACGPGYGRPPQDLGMAPWTVDPAVPLDSAKSASAPAPVSSPRVA
jgi:hypothetical protein